MSTQSQRGSGAVVQRKKWLLMLSQSQGYIGLLLIVLIGLWSQGGRFADIGNLTNAIGYFAPRGILAVGMTLVIITGGIDLSVGAVMAVGSTTSAWLLTEMNWPVIAIVPTSMAVGALFGIISGIGTAYLKIQSFVMTLAIMTIARGFTREFSHNVSIGTNVIGPDGEVAPGSQQFRMLGTPGETLFPIPLIGYLSLIHI